MSSQAAPAAHSSFYSAMRILPEKQREAMFTLYGFCREVDDIADDRGPATAAERLARWPTYVGLQPKRAGLRHRAPRQDPNSAFKWGWFSTPDP